MKFFLALNFENNIMQRRKIQQMIKQNSFHNLVKNVSRETIGMKGDRTSFHTHSLRKKPPCQSTNLRGRKNLPIINSKNQTIPIYLLYKNQKFLVKSFHGMRYSQLVALLYEQILKYEQIGKHKSKEENQKYLKSILGFSTSNGDLNTDYLLSILEGSVEKSLILHCFISPKNNNKKEENQSFYANSTKQRSLENEKFEYEIYKCLAIGGFSKVYLARSYEDGKFYAMKFIKKKRDKDYELNRESVKNQMRISSKFNHPFIIQMREGFQTPNFFGMVFQYCPGGQLFFLLKKIRTMSQENARFYFIQILLGIKHIHEANILYRDLKPENILVDYKGNLKIVDFGLSKQMQSGRDKTYSYCGSAEYMAPEMILRLGHNISVDYYSLGALLYQLVTGLPPYYTKNPQQLKQSIIHQKLSFPAHTPLSLEIKDLLSHLLEKDQKHRLGSYVGIKQIMFHPWIGKFKPEAYLSKRYQNVPYPPNLAEHNFDQTELGDDEQDFTTEVFKEISNKSSISFQYHVKGTAYSKNHIYNDIIHKVIQQNEEITHVNRENDSFILNKANTRRFKNKRREFYKFDNQIQDEKERSSYKTSSIHSNSQIFMKRVNPFLMNSSRCESPAQSKENRHKSKEKLEKLQKSMRVYQKLFPYFSKNKVYKPQNLVRQVKQLPRANILRLKVLETTIRD